MEADPFPGLSIDSGEFLDSLDGRSSCPKCGKSRKYYCYTCYVPVSGIEDRVPKVTLPLKVDVIKHPSECDGKSTAAHAGVLAPDYVTVYTYPVIPDYEDKDKVLLVFPGENSKTIEELSRLYKAQTSEHKAECSLSSQSCQSRNVTENAKETSLAETQSQEPVCNSSSKRKPDEDEGPHNAKRLKSADMSSLPFNRVVFIDSTWNQTKKIFLDERLKGLQQIELKTQMTRFWRHQRDKPKSYLATIEAIYFFLRDYHECFISDKYDGQYDNLLFFFSYMYHKIRALYDGGKKLKAYEQS